MAIRFSCLCGQELQASDGHGGRVTRCPSCKAELTIPSVASDIQAEPPRATDQPANHKRWGNDEDRPRSVERTGSSGKAWASLVFGVLSFCFSLAAGIPAIILGILGLRDINASRGRLSGQGAAITGIVLGAIGSLLVGPALIAVVISLLLPAVQKVREASARIQTSNNLKIMCLATIIYADSHNGDMPPANFRAAGPDAPVVVNYGKPGLSWRVAILPYIEEGALYRQFHLDEPWDSPHNRTLLTRMPRVFDHPNSDPSKAAAGFTYYRAFVGPHTAFDPTLGRPVKFPAEFTDGPSNTILFVEAAEPVEWTKPDDLDFGPGVPLPKLGVVPKRNINVGLADGSSRSLSPSISETTLRAAITRDGMEVLGPDW
jgi:hypothetical protein